MLQRDRGRAAAVHSRLDRVATGRGRSGGVVRRKSQGTRGKKGEMVDGAQTGQSLPWGWMRWRRIRMITVRC